MCELDINPRDVTDQLARLLKMKPEWKTKVALDPDLTWLHKTYAFQTLLGRNPSIDADLVIMLESISWYGPNPGAYGPMGTVDFHNGYCTFTSVNLDEEITRTISKPYPYTVSKGVISVITDEKLHDGTYKVIHGKLVDGILSFEGKSFRYTDDPDYCSA